MKTQEILSSIDQGTIPPGTQVFPYQLLYAGGSFVLKLGGILFFAVTLILMVTVEFSNTKTDFIVILFSLGCGGYCAYSVWKQFPELKHHQKTMIVVTSEGVIRRLGLRVEEFPFKIYSTVRWVARYGSIEVYLGDGQEEKQLISNKHFGMGNHISQAIYERQRAYNPNAKIAATQQTTDNLDHR